MISDQRTSGVGRSRPQRSSPLPRLISELGLPTRIENRLNFARIDTVADLVGRTEAEMLGVRGLRQKSVDTLKAILAGVGLKFRV